MSMRNNSFWSSLLDPPLSFGVAIWHYFQSSEGIVILATVILASTFNITFIVVTLRSQKLNNIRSCLTVALSCCNIATAMGYCTIGILSSYQGVNFSFARGIFFFISADVWQTLVMLAVAVERFIAVVYPFRYPIWITKNRLISVILASFVVSVLCGSTVFMIPSVTILDAAMNAMAQNRTITYNDLQTKEGNICSQLWSVSHIALGFLIMGLYIPILVSIEQQQSKIQASDQTSIKKNHKGTVVLCVVILYYFTCYTPQLVANTLPQVLDQPMESSANGSLGDFINFLGILVCTPTFVNPFLYGMLNQSFRKELFGYCTCL